MFKGYVITLDLFVLLKLLKQMCFNKIGVFSRLFAIAMLLILAALTNYAQAQITFTKHCETEVIKLINSSNDTIDIAVYSINNDNIIKALEQAKQRNVKIQILTDRIQAFGKSSKVKQLHSKGFL